MSIEFESTAPGGAHNRSINPYLKNKMSEEANEASAGLNHLGSMILSKWPGNTKPRQSGVYGNQDSSSVAVPVDSDGGSNEEQPVPLATGASEDRPGVVV